MNKIQIAPLSFMLVLAALTGNASADVLGDRETFFVNSDYDADDRTTASATLVHMSDNAYFYVEDIYLNRLFPLERRLLEERLVEVGKEFDEDIYNKQTAFWGSEPKPGIDEDPRLTILLERLNPGTGGYFDSVNNYPPVQVSNTNEREMIVANVASVYTDQFNVFLAHELQHLISFNQKELIRKVFEEVWLNETRSQYAVTVSGYNDDFNSSDLLNRASVFLRDPSDSLTEWPNLNVDYASVTLFGHYLVDRFGPGILQETLQSRLGGIASINEYFSNHRRPERFSDIFADWVWANYLNDRDRDSRYGYANPGLRSLHVVPNSKILNSSVSNVFSYSLKPWQPIWERFFLDLTSSKNIKISWSDPRFKIYHGDPGTGVRALRSGDVIASPSNGRNFILMPVNESKMENFGTSEAALPLALTIEYVDQAASAAISSIQDGMLIKHAGVPDIYVVTGPYKRYLAPEILKFYGLDASQAITVSESTFQSYMVSNYIRSVNEKKVYAVWPDGTKHWLNMSAQHFTDSYRDWNSIFIVNDLESNFYRIGPDIRR